MKDVCAANDGFRLHAAVCSGADGRQVFGQWCRSITRVAPADEPLQCNAAGQVVPSLITH